MSSSLLVMAPFVLLAIVSSLCFVGCGLDTQGNLFGQPLFRYSDDTVINGEADRLLAYWRLNEGAGSTAVNSKNAAANGTYTSQMFLADDKIPSAGAPGTLTFGLAGLLGGDLQSPSIAGSARQTLYLCQRRRSSRSPGIPPSRRARLTVSRSRPGSTLTGADKEPKADRAVIVSLELSGAGLNGFGIKATKDKTWQAFIGTGTGIEFTPDTPLDYDSLNHLVATYAAGELKLYVNGVHATSKLATYAPTTGASPTGEPSQLYIGAGGTHLKAPVIPFVGRMQCVALYRGASRARRCDQALQRGKNRPHLVADESRPPGEMRMSTSLLVMMPFVLLAIVSAICFVGCVFDTTGDGPGTENPPLFKYSDDTVLPNEATLLAYWRLNEASGPTAVNARNPGTADGTYVSQPFPDDPSVNSVAAPGTLSFGQAGMLAGDLQPPFTAGSPRQPSVFVDGAFVKVGWDPTIAPSEAEGFTIEAWVHVGWAEKEPKADRAVIVSLESNGVGLTASGLWRPWIRPGRPSSAPAAASTLPPAARSTSTATIIWSRPMRRASSSFT